MVRQRSNVHPLPPRFNLLDYELSTQETNGSLIANVFFKISPLLSVMMKPSPDGQNVIYAPNPLKFLNSFPQTGVGSSSNAEGTPSSSTRMDHLFTRHVYPMEWFALPGRCKPAELFEIGINLAAATDAEVLAEIKQLLPLWRQRATLPEPVKNETGVIGPSIIRRIVQYKVIPMVDLMVWAKIQGFQYSAEQLSRVLYPDTEGVMVTAKQMAETRIPFALGFIDLGYQDLLRLWLSETGPDGKRNGERLVRTECLDLNVVNQC